MEALKSGKGDSEVLSPLLCVLERLHFLKSISNSVNHQSLLLRMLTHLSYLHLPGHRLLMSEGETGRELFLMLVGKLAVIQLSPTRSLARNISEKAMQELVYFLIDERRKHDYTREEALTTLAFCNALRHERKPFREYFTEQGVPQFSILATFNETQVIGELALINEGRRSATVVSVEDCELGVLSKESFKVIFEECISATREAFECLAGYMPDEESSQLTMLSVVCEPKSYAPCTRLWAEN